MRLRRVVVGMDFADPGQHAVRRVTLLPLESGAEIVIVNVLPGGLDEDLLARLRSRAVDLLSSASALVVRDCERAGLHRLKVETMIEVGRAAEQIQRIATLRGAELVVLGRGRPHGATDRLLGSTAERIARSCEASVLLVAGAPIKRYVRPLVGVDLTSASRRAVEMTLRIAPDAEAVDVLHVFDVEWVSMLGPSVMTKMEIDERVGAAESAAQTRLAAWLPSLPADAALRPELKRGDPRQVLVEEAARRQADLVAVGPSEPSTLGRWFLGSVAEQVARAAPSDVLVAR